MALLFLSVFFPPLCSALCSIVTYAERVEKLCLKVDRNALVVLDDERTGRRASIRSSHRLGGAGRVRVTDVT